jgi:hypothetical protein
MAERWLRERLLPAAAVAPDTLILVSGNHDVDRSKIKLPGKALRKKLLTRKNQDAVAEVLRDSSARRPLLGSHGAWLAFARRLGAPVRHVPWFTRAIDVRGVRVQVMALCSSWCACSNQDRGRLLVGRYQLVQTKPAQADVIIALLHHPWDMLAEFDVTAVREEVWRKCDLVLRGHRHVADGVQLTRPGSTTLELTAGASYSGSTYPNSYEWIEFDQISRRVRVYMQQWDGHAWLTDRNSYGGAAKDGYVEFSLSAAQQGRVGQGRSRRTRGS